MSSVAVGNAFVSVSRYTLLDTSCHILHKKSLPCADIYMSTYTYTLFACLLLLQLSPCLLLLQVSATSAETVEREVLGISSVYIYKFEQILRQCRIV